MKNFTICLLILIAGTFALPGKSNATIHNVEVKNFVFNPTTIINAMNFRDYNNVVFIGEETSGRPNHFGEVKSFALPHSGLTVSYSTKYFQLTNANGNTIIPDVKIQSTIYDYLQGRDAVMEYIFEQ